MEHYKVYKAILYKEKIIFKEKYDKKTHIINIINDCKIIPIKNKYYDIKDINIYKSKIIKLFINDKMTMINSYTKAIETLYKKINNVSDIMVNTCINIINCEKDDKGFRYIPELKFSYQRPSALKSLQELLIQSIKNNIKFIIEIKLLDEQSLIIITKY
jgi:hypothetical protein